MARISIFKGREARLNKALFRILAKHGPQAIYDVWQKVRAERDFAYVHYHVVNRRVRALEEQSYVKREGERRTKTGFVIPMYQLTARAYLATLLDRINLDDFIEKASDASVLSALAAITLAHIEEDTPTNRGDTRPKKLRSSK